MKKSIVSIAKYPSAERMVEEVLFHLGGVRSLIKPKSTVVIKPNAGHLAPTESSVNASPAFVAAVIKELRKAHPKEIILAESSSIGCDTMECLEVSGIKKASEDAGIDRIIDIKKEKDLIKIPIRDARSEMTKVSLPRFLLEADHVINLPHFKSHCTMIFSCALKNIKGIVQDNIHFQMHQTNLTEAMIDLWSVFKPDLTIVDLIKPGVGFGPHATMPGDFGCIVAGKDPVAVDATVCRMVGLPIERVGYFEPARERGLGNSDEDLIEIRGKAIQEVFRELWLPYLRGLDIYSDYRIDPEGSCSSCQGLLALTMERLKAAGKYEENAGISILIGRKKNLPKGIDARDMILVGNCLKKWRGHGIFISGCPPRTSTPFRAIIDRENYKEAGPEKEGMSGEENLFKEHMRNLKKQWENERDHREGGHL